MTNASAVIVDVKIKKKHDILKEWLADLPWKRDLNGDPVLDESGRRIFEYFPTTRPQFAKWDGSQNSEFARINELMGISRVSQGSVDDKGRAGTMKAVQETMDSLKFEAKRKQDKVFRRSEIAELKQENAYLKALNAQQTRDVGELHARLVTVEKEMRKEKRAHQGTLEESRRSNAALERKVAELTANLNVVTGLKEHGRKN